MSATVHRIYILLLFSLGIGTALVVGINGCEYYTTGQDKINNLKADLDAKISDIDVELEMRKQNLGAGGKSDSVLARERAQLKRDVKYWEDWKSAGPVGHGLGIIGSAMMITGVTLYSSRKRVKRLRYVGKIKHWLEFHIFLCLLGPTLVLYHTTFIFGGIVAVSAWSMIFVALSGILGRYIYTQIPKGIEGNELSLADLTEQNERFQRELATTYALDEESIAEINSISHVRSGEGSTLNMVLALISDDLSRRTRVRAVKRHLAHRGIDHRRVHDIARIAKEKSLLLRRIAFLDTARNLFHYWHVVHLPFSIIMFLILAVHVAVTVSLGYRWIF